jgi:hypothetical protein
MQGFQKAAKGLIPDAEYTPKIKKLLAYTFANLRAGKSNGICSKLIYITPSSMKSWRKLMIYAMKRKVLQSRGKGFCGK